MVQISKYRIAILLYVIYLNGAKYLIVFSCYFCVIIFVLKILRKIASDSAGYCAQYKFTYLLTYLLKPRPRF